MLRTDLCEVLNIKYPILQGGMAWVATAELAAAVSNAGGLGIIAAGNAPSEIVEQEIQKAKNLTTRPFGVNVMLLSPFVEDVMEIIYKHKVPVVTTGAGNPGKYIKKLKEIGTKIVPVVPSIALAKRMESLGVDAVIVEGTEAGGHIGELTTFALVPQVVDELNIPVIAAGGIADGRGLVAALALGAQGVQMGTRFICSNECTAHDKYKEMVMKAKDRDAIVTARTSGHPVRVLKNKFAKEIAKLEKENISLEELEKIGIGKLRLAVVEGDVENGSVMAGQIAAMVKDIKPCGEIIDEVIRDAKVQLERLKGLSKEGL
ncbi:enoyl-[acyl-carrier protein] reductase FabI [Clostridium aceticum]|uniref:Probable nitronate monooxygenase n=1 Tax=Clostridium aceticum TaxID=84022 RepID=A0A0D8I6U1_9CLOT|nr:enoyl-[acyl-carrier-protein] reductase FabK [Clostridium aceticum]AKL95513.1 enoyl-[acyl-carrier protein] reductase FabI [Clostridium aceticum]KJF25995.1 2-nitropropane dioxygenase [Clostridium aceticum]